MAVSLLLSAINLFFIRQREENDVLSHVFPVEAEDRSVDGSTAHKEEMVDQRSDQWLDEEVLKR